jgi:hypothetical protein
MKTPTKSIPTKPLARRSERGSALVEASLIFLLGTGLLFGSFDIAQMLFMHQTVVDRTRTAARYGSVNEFDADAIRNLVLYNSTTAGDSGTGLFGMTSSNVTVTRYGANTLEDRLDVRVSGYTFPLFSAALVNGYASASGNNGSQNGNDSVPAVWHTGLSTHVSVPYEYVP